MIEDSFKFAADDVSARKVIEARLDAGALITTTEKSLSDGGHLVEPEEVARIRTALAALASAKEGTDPVPFADVWPTWSKPPKVSPWPCWTTP